MMEQRSESVMTSSSVSYQSSGFYPSDHNRPLSSERKSPNPNGIARNPIEDAMIRKMLLHSFWVDNRFNLWQI